MIYTQAALRRQAWARPVFWTSWFGLHGTSRLSSDSTEGCSVNPENSINNGYNVDFEEKLRGFVPKASTS